MKKTLSIVLLLMLLTFAFAGCGGASVEPTKLSFAESTNIDTLRKLDGKQVTLIGYMATLSPLDGQYIYLMNLPYQSCPFCVPNTQQLANTMAVYAAKNVTFDYTDQPIRITGKMELGDYTDDYGYEYNYRIVNALYEIVNLADVSAEYALYQSLAEDGVISDVNAMFDYLMFVCQWTEYMGTTTDESGIQIPYSIYPGDAENALIDDGLYGYATQSSSDYFPTLIQRVKAISATELTDLTAIISDAAALEQYARTELAEGNYTYDETADKYTLNNDEDLYTQFYDVYNRFSDWMTHYEL